MSQRYAGGLINKSAPVVVGPVDGEGGTASGVWTLEQAGNYIKQGTWPKPIIPKSLFSWGGNTHGQLGLNIAVAEYKQSPVQVGSLTTWSKVACGSMHDIAIKTDGTLWTWGYNSRGALGQNIIYTTDRSSPVQVGSLTTWLNVSGGDYLTIATKTDNSLWSWGYNNDGQLGQNDVVYRSSPVQVGALTTWSNTSNNYQYTTAIKTDGTLWAWGQNTQGQLGQNNKVNQSSPVQVGSLTTWSTISNGSYFTLAIKTDGTLWSWGGNTTGELGQGDKVSRSSPVQVGSLTTWSKVACGSQFSIATKTDGTLWAWGRNIYGQLGLNIAYATNRSSPVQVGALTTWSKVACGEGSAIAIKTDKTLWSWGRNDLGQLGVNIAPGIRRSSPVQVGALTTWLTASAGVYQVLAISS